MHLETRTKAHQVKLDNRTKIQSDSIKKGSISSSNLETLRRFQSTIEDVRNEVIHGFSA